ncbi:MAG: hydrolase [Gammaproteobacteria bacterium]|nr:hydrolase [Gammaproteobacteria bacterium]
MGEKAPTRAEALALLKQYTKTDSLIKHGLAVEAVMRHFARARNGDEEKWGIVGLVHDLDWDRYPEEHCTKTREILQQNEWPEEYIRAVISHGWGICTDVEPESDMEKVLYAVDELTGLVTTAALVRPSRSLMDLEAKSVKKKWKDKRFAAKIDRSIIDRGAGMIGMERGELISETILGMREIADELGLRGQG